MFYQVKSLTQVCPVYFSCNIRFIFYVYWLMWWIFMANWSKEATLFLPSFPRHLNILVWPLPSSQVFIILAKPSHPRPQDAGDSICSDILIVYVIPPAPSLACSHKRRREGSLKPTENFKETQIKHPQTETLMNCNEANLSGLFVNLPRLYNTHQQNTNLGKYNKDVLSEKRVRIYSIFCQSKIEVIFWFIVYHSRIWMKTKTQSHKTSYI